MTKRFLITTDPATGELICTELPGYKLPEIKVYQDDDISNQAAQLAYSRRIKYQREYEDGVCSGLEEGYILGYNKAREKYQFTEADINNALSYGYHTAKDELNGIPSTGYGTRFIQSLRTPRIPIAIDVEMKVEDGFLMQLPPCKHCLIPATQPDNTVKGLYVYE